MLTVKEAKMPRLNRLQRNHLAYTLRGMTVSASIPVVVGLDSLPLPSEFKCNHGMEVVHHSIN